MRVTPDAGSPWGQRLWFEDHEFDAMADEVRRKAGPDAFVEGKGVDVEAILERVYRVVPDYTDLPSPILGKTLFLPDGRFEVYVSRELSTEAESSVVGRRRLRSTLAHECAHIVQHGCLQVPDAMTRSLFDEPVRESPRVLCRAETVGAFRGPGGYDGQWWEYQANRGMASLLLPRREIVGYVRELLAGRECRSMAEAFETNAGEAVVRDIVRIFDVSMQAVLYRLQELEIVPRNVAQTALALEERTA